MAEALSERDLIAALEAGLAGIAPVRWGWKAMETAEQSPSLPLVVLQRTVASAAQWHDMCANQRAQADTSVQIHTWHAEYEAARTLNAQVRDIVRATGWALQAEIDSYEPGFRAWSIAGEYLAVGLMMD